MKDNGHANDLQKAVEDHRDGQFLLHHASGLAYTAKEDKRAKKAYVPSGRTAVYL